MISFIGEYAQIAQLVEQRTENPRVTGSIPVLGIFNVEKFIVIFFISVVRKNRFFYVWNKKQQIISEN